MVISNKSSKKSNYAPVAICVILVFSFFSFTPDKYMQLLFNPGTELCAVGSAFLEPAFQNTVYSDSIRWNPPADSTIPTPFGPLTVPFDSFALVQVTGLPPGITYTCDDPNSNCSWVANPPNATIAHIKLNGNPANATSGKYKLKIEVKYWLTIFGSPTFLTETDSALFIFLCPFENNSTQLEVKQLNTDLTLGNGLSSGYYIGTNSVTGNGIINASIEATFLGGNQVLLNPPFQVEVGGRFLAGTCPE